MKLKSDKDIIVLKIETTGLSITKSKIIQINLLKIFADGSPMETKSKLVNPEMDIPKIVTDLTGITNEMVKDQPTFKKYAKGILDYIGDCDIITYNGNEFDIPILMEHYENAGMKLDMSGRRTIDAMSIYHQMERRDLKGAVHRFLGKYVKGQIRGEKAVKATLAVLEGMLDTYKETDCYMPDDTVLEKPIQNDIKSLSDFSRQEGGVDFAGYIKKNKDGIPVMNFGKHKDEPVVPTLIDDSSYYDWIMNKGEFTKDTRSVIKDIVESYRILQEDAQAKAL